MIGELENKKNHQHIARIKALMANRLRDMKLS